MKRVALGVALLALALVVTLVARAAVLTLHASLVDPPQGATWHRALPTLPGSPMRRVLMIAYSPTWMQQVDVPASVLSNSLRASESRNIQELLGAKSVK